MRQAGRSLPQYRKLRKKYDVLTICKTPELAAEVTLQPIEVLGVDAAILFADIMLPLLALGVDVRIVDAVGPVIQHPIRNARGLASLRSLEPDRDFAHVRETIRIILERIGHNVPLIGFAGAPFTLASYLIEGRPSRDFLKTKSLMYANPGAWEKLMKMLTQMTISYLGAQAQAGVHAIQLFDSWAGCLSPQDYAHYVLPYTRKIFTSLRRYHIPLIHFGTNTAGMLKVFSSVDCDVVGIDWRISLDEAWKTIGRRKAIQGNLDPAMLLSDFSLIRKKVDALFKMVGGRNGYIFNLGHGVLPETPLGNLKKLVAYVHAK